jgi:hypothetical protein
MLDWILVSGALPILCRVVNFVGGEVQQWCAGGTSNWDGVISGLPQRRVCRISCYLMHDAQSVPWEVRTLNDWRTKKKWQLSASV